MSDRGLLRVRFNRSMAAVFIAAIVCATLFWGGLLWTKAITFAQFCYFCAGVAGFIVAKLLPAVLSYYREKDVRPVSLELDSDPPSKGGSDANS